MAKKEARKSLLDDVLSSAVRSKPGFSCWYDRLPPEARAELDIVRAAFDPKIHQKTTYAEAVMDACKKRGWETSGKQGVIDWLSKKQA